MLIMTNWGLVFIHSQHLCVIIKIVFCVIGRNYYVSTESKDWFSFFYY
ncbi:unnamed protein product [Schistosoma curassoni]|uniref:Uncharacterized protein n=1 Tax=Schistosoma curassoni TaxID=6186 RepID=A0A183KX66_9TREM|nr:unnamed protein product [Schistosoma curassoni]